MRVKRYDQLVQDCLDTVSEIFPWDLVELQDAVPGLFVLDVREPYEFAVAHIPGSLCVPRGILESSCEYGYEETMPELVEAREREIIVVCRSGYRSVLAAYTMRQMGYLRTRSLKTGLKGWNDYEQVLVDDNDVVVDIDVLDEYFRPKLTTAQLGPGRPDR